MNTETQLINLSQEKESLGESFENVVPFPAKIDGGSSRARTGPLDAKFPEELLAELRVDSEEHKKKNIRKNTRPVRMSRSWWALLPRIVIYLLACAACVGFSQSFPETLLNIPLPFFGVGWTLTVPPLWLLCGLALFRALTQMHNSRNEIRTHHIRAVSGRCSFERKEIDIPYEDISWVHVKQNIFQRMVDVGDLSVGVGDRSEVTVCGLGNPHKYANMIYRKLAKVRFKRYTK